MAAHIIPIHLDSQRLIHKDYLSIQNVQGFILVGTVTFILGVP